MPKIFKCECDHAHFTGLIEHYENGILTNTSAEFIIDGARKRFKFLLFDAPTTLFDILQTFSVEDRVVIKGWIGQNGGFVLTDCYLYKGEISGA